MYYLCGSKMGNERERSNIELNTKTSVHSGS